MKNIIGMLFPKLFVLSMLFMFGMALSENESKFVFPGPRMEIGGTGGVIVPKPMPQALVSCLLVVDQAAADSPCETAKLLGGGTLADLMAAAADIGGTGSPKPTLPLTKVAVTANALKYDVLPIGGVKPPRDNSFAATDTGADIGGTQAPPRGYSVEPLIHVSHEYLGKGSSTNA